MRADTTTQQLEQRLQQIAQRVTPCPVPDITGGWDLCAHGLPWPCPTTEAAWIARGLDPTEQIHASMAWLHGERAEAYANAGNATTLR
jgi:hypothetical protein